VDAHTLAGQARDAGVLVSVLAPDLGRLITHLDLDDAALDQAIDVLTSILRG
jgi:threonine aldolase